MRRSLLAARATEVAALVAAATPSASSPPVRSRSARRGSASSGGPRRCASSRLRRPSARRSSSRPGSARSSRVGLQAAQILLSPADVADRQTYVNVCNTFDALFRLGAVPVVNENDATATDEITFGDNDALAAQVAVLTHARLLVLLTEVDGVYSRAPGTPGAELLDDGSLTAAVRLGRGTGLGRGGMGSKIAAAELAAGAGIPTVIASGQAETVLGPIVAGERRGTRFEGGAAPAESAFKLWIRYGKRPRGTVVLDAGAERALRAAGASVLAVGVTACDGGVRPRRRDRARLGERRPDRQGHRLDRGSRGRLPRARAGGRQPRPARPLLTAGLSARGATSGPAHSPTTRSSATPRCGSGSRS